MLWLCLAALALLTPRCVEAQAEPAGLGPGSYIAVGVTGSGFNSGYGQQHLLGPTVYLDANLYRRVGFEAASRSLRFHSQNDVRQTTYLAGVRLTSHRYGIRPYTRLLAGMGNLTFPYHDAQGRYLVVAPGAGLDWRLQRSRLQLRLFDFEYQYWPHFTFGPLRTWGISTGFSVRVR